MKVYDLIILGAGPAGLTAAIYAKRAGLTAALIEKNIAGGQVNSAARVENYPGFNGIEGFELMQKMLLHAESGGIEVLYGAVSGVNLGGKIKSVTLNGEVLEAKSVIVASGAGAKKLNVKGEDELLGAGISYCATCDGSFFKGKNIMVYGGGKQANEDIDYLLPIAGKLYAADSGDLSKLTAKGVEKVPFSEVISLNGNPLKSVTLLIKGGETRDIDVSGLFVAAGYSPNSFFVSDELELDKTGHIVVDENLQTRIPGVFAAGDVRTNAHKQIVSACSDGARAVGRVVKYLHSSNDG